MGGISRRQFLVGSGCLLSSAGLAWRTYGTIGHTTSPDERSEVDPSSVSRWETTQPLVSLTFDDGPDPRFTPDVLRALHRAGVQATFFLIGRNAVEHPELVRQILADGHEVANHTHNHLWLDDQPRAVVHQEIRQAHEALAGAEAARWFRPPRGWTSPTVVSATRDLGYRSIFWDGSFEGYQSRGVPEATKVVIESARPGSVILCHDGGALAGPNPQNIDRSRTVQALPGILAGLTASGLTPVTVSRLLAS